MALKDYSYVLIDKKSQLEAFWEQNKNVQWMGFDTEFIGEKRYHTLLCLVQIATEHGYFLIDTLKLKSFPQILDLITDPNILKITHAGENDYRIFYQQYGIVPQNVFDTQLAAGFVGYKYPTSFQKLVEKELGVFVPKGYTVSDWEARPIADKQIKYALNDVLYLHGLWSKLNQQLESMNRVQWALEECKKFCNADFYKTNPFKDAFNNNTLPNLNGQSQVFMIRLYEWRRREAERKNYSKEMVLPNKYITPIVKNIVQGKKALMKDRRLPSATIAKHWNVFNDLYSKKVSGEEKQILRKIPQQIESPDPKQNTMLEMLYSIVEYICHENLVAPSLILNRTSFKKMKSDPEFFEESIATGWRSELLGKDLLRWLRVRKDLIIEMNNGQCVIRMEE